MSIQRSLIAVGFVVLICGFGGCAGLFSVDSSTSGASNFLGIAFSDFTDDRALSVRNDAVTSESTDVALPRDLLEAVPNEAKLVLSATDVAVLIDSEGETSGAQQNRAEGDEVGTVERHAWVIFRLANGDSDACDQGALIGPFEVNVGDGVVTLTEESLPLTPEARAVVQNSRFRMCAQIQGDFDGTVAVRKMSLEFGRLRGGENRVELCHIPPGDPDNLHTITVGASAVDAHLAHGDYLGACVVGDDDDDGVPDDTDNCPDTAESEQADADGCSCSQLDFDTDGVSDCDDDCPATPEGEQADANGCSCSQRDSDADGVSDCDDDCSSTPEGEQPDDAGCSCSQQDGDGDGVNDCDDLCPNTSGDSPVDANGCALDPLDDDSDGVPDDQDVCPNTPFGEQSDSFGCSCSQKDTDSDGIDDCADACPGTPAEEPPDEDGCGCSQSDGDGDGVPDCDDLCPDTPAVAQVNADGCHLVQVDAGPDITVDEIGCITLQGSATGGTPPYTYVWSAPGWEGSMEQNPVVVPTQTFVYTLEVTDWSTPPITVSDFLTVTVNTHDGLAYTITNLGAGDGIHSFGAGLNDLGQVVGYYYTSVWKKRAFLYDNGSMKDLGTLGGAESYARDVNNAGQVVGQSITGGGDVHAFLWDAAGGMGDLGTLGGATSVAYAINESAQIVGVSDTGSANHAFLYSDGTMTNLGILDYNQSGAFDINDLGQVAGTYFIDGSFQEAFVYVVDNGVLIDLGSPLLSASRAWAINNDGLVAGYSWGGGENRSFLYACGVTVDLGTVEGFPDVFAWGMNDRGQVVGYVTSADGIVSHAFIYTGGRLRDLNDLLVPGHGWDRVTVAFDVNNTGQITGYGRINGQVRAFLMAPSQNQ